MAITLCMWCLEWS